MSKRNREYYLKKTYGMSKQDYQQLLDTQNGGCKVCGKKPGLGKHSGLHVDHDHVTGKVRGLLCYPCNSAIGLAHDDPETLRNLADYLESEAV